MLFVLVSGINICPSLGSIVRRLNIKNWSSCGKVIRYYHEILSYYKFVLVAQGTEGTQGSPGAQGNPGAEVGCPISFAFPSCS